MLEDSPAKAPRAGKGKSKFSADTLRRMREGQQRRWAKVKGRNAPAQEEKSKRVLSADGRANIVAALKKRWAAKKATVGAQPATASKKAGRKKAD